MSKIFGLVGFIGSGKGTVANLLANTYNFKEDSFASSLKDACSVIFDWPRHLLEGDTVESRIWRETVDLWWSKKLNIPNFSPRYALQNIGTDLFRDQFNKDIWCLTLENRLRKNTNGNIIVSDARFPNEIQLLQRNGAILVKINRGNLPEWYEIALLANGGDEKCKNIMETTYEHVHFSEWAWIGSKIDYEIDNNGTLDNLKQQIDFILRQ